MVLVTGKTTVLKSVPGEVAVKEVAMSGLTTGGSAFVTLAERDSKTDTRGQPEFWAKCEADNLIITCEEPELKNDTDVFYIVDLDGSGFNETDFKKEWASVPASASASGTAGDMAYDADYLYVCVATDTWVRAALSTWA